LAENDGLGDGKALLVQSRDGAELAVDRVRRRQQLARRLPAQHVAARRRLELIGRVRLPALELTHGQRAGEARDVAREKLLQTLDWKAQGRRHLLGAGERHLFVDQLHCGQKKSSSALAVACGFSSGRKCPHSIAWPRTSVA